MVERSLGKGEAVSSILTSSSPLKRNVMSRSLFLKILLPIAIIGGGVFSYRMIAQEQDLQPLLEQQEDLPKVNTLRTGRQTERPRLHAFGQISVATPIEIRAGVSGLIDRREDVFTPGAIVEKGQLLLTFDRQDLLLNAQEAQERLAEAQAQLEEINLSLEREEQLLEVDQTLLQLALSKLQRQTDLRQRGIISAELLDTVTTETERARRSVIQGRSQIAILESHRKRQLATIERLQIALKRTERDLELTMIVAPERSIVDSVLVNRGTRVSTYQSLGTLSPIDSLEVEFRLSSEQYVRLVTDVEPLIGRAVQMTWNETASFEGVIKRIAPRIESSQGGIVFYASLLSPPDFLRPGVFVGVVLDDALFADVLRIPAQAIMPDGNIYLVQNTRSLTSLPARIVLRIGEDVLIDSSQIPPDLCLVTTPFNQIAEGVEVEPVGCDPRPDSS